MIVHNHLQKQSEVRWPLEVDYDDDDDDDDDDDCDDITHEIITYQESPWSSQLTG